MKVTPVAQGTGVPSAQVTAQPDPSKIERAKAAFEGVELSEKPSGDPQVDRIKNRINRIKMKTQVSTNRDDSQVVQQEPVVEEAIETKPLESPIVDSIEQVNGNEDTKPIDPQSAELVKYKRALQVKERELAELKAKPSFKEEDYVSKADIKANALNVLLREGVTYDQLTEQILANNQSGVTPEITSLKAELKALKEEINGQLSTRDQQAETQVLAEMTREAMALTAEGEEFEAIRQAKAQKDVVKLVHRVWKEGWEEKGFEPGTVLDIPTAAEIVENQLIEDSLPLAGLKKVQSRLTPAEEAVVEKILAQPKPNTKVMRTLTNRDTASPIMDRRARAIAAMQGTLKKG